MGIGERRGYGSSGESGIGDSEENSLAEIQSLPTWTREARGIKDVLGRGNGMCEVTEVCMLWEVCEGHQA